LAAGLPVITPDLVSYRLFFEKHPVGATYSNMKDLMEKIPLVLKIRAIQKDFAFDTQTKDVETFYVDCINRNEFMRSKDNFLEFKLIYQKNIHNWLAFLRAMSKKKLLNTLNIPLR
jgi:hypothetical protein